MAGGFPRFPARQTVRGGTRQKERGTRRVFVGVHERQLDERGRVALPSPFRGDLGEHCYLFLGDDGCVSVRSEESFQAQAAKLIEQVKPRRGESRPQAGVLVVGGSSHDRQAGRITLDARLPRTRRDRSAGHRDGARIARPDRDLEPGRLPASEEAGQHEIAGGAR